MFIETGKERMLILCCVFCPYLMSIQSCVQNTKWYTMSNNNVETKEKREKYTVAKGKTSTSPFPPFPVRKVHCFINVRTKSEDMCALVLTVVLSGYFSQWTYCQQQFSSFSLPKNIMHFSPLFYFVLCYYFIYVYILQLFVKECIYLISFFG